MADEKPPRRKCTCCLIRKCRPPHTRCTTCQRHCAHDARTCNRPPPLTIKMVKEGLARAFALCEEQGDAKGMAHVAQSAYRYLADGGGPDPELPRNLNEATMRENAERIKAALEDTDAGDQ